VLTRARCITRVAQSFEENAKSIAVGTLVASGAFAIWKLKEAFD
jgi:hypothetical protein